MLYGKQKKEIKMHRSIDWFDPLQGLPDVWQQSALPSDDILDTSFINPNLVPQKNEAPKRMGGYSCIFKKHTKYLFIHFH